MTIYIWLEEKTVALPWPDIFDTKNIYKKNK